MLSYNVVDSCEVLDTEILVMFRLKLRTLLGYNVCFEISAVEERSVSDSKGTQGTFESDETTLGCKL